MLCCCKKSPSSSSYALAADKDQPQTLSINYHNAHVQTGKGALSSSSNSLGPQEAQLDKSTVAATAQENHQNQRNNNTSAVITTVVTPPSTTTTTATNNTSTAVTKQPTSSSPRNQAQKTSGEDLKKSPSSSVVEVGVGKKEVAIVEESQICAEVSGINSSSPNHTTVISVGGGVSSDNNRKNSNDSDSGSFIDLNREFDSIEAAVEKAEKSSTTSSFGEVKKCVGQLAIQLQALTLQVTEAVGQGHKSSKMADMNSAVSRLEAVASRLEALAVKGGQAGGAGASSDEVAPFVLEFDVILNGPLAQFFSLANAIGGDVQKQCELVKAAFDAERALLVIASRSKQPTGQEALMAVLKPISSKMEEIQEFREKNRRSEFFNHLSTISESIAALGWVTVAPAPSPFVKEMLDAGMFYSNRVLKDFKEKDQKHVDWTKAWTSVLKDLQAYVKSSHTTGLTWNPQGGEAKATTAAPSAPKAGGSAPPPPPPPTGPPPPMEEASATKPAGDDAKNALFASINQGGDVTKGLKKVSDDMKTHKNPALRQGPAPFKAVAPKPTPLPKPGAAPKTVAQVKPPVFELRGKKWIIENHKDNKSLVIEGDIKQTVYVFKCEGSVVQVKGKINSVVLDTCKKTAVVFDDVLSSVEFVNCQSVQGQVTGKLNTLTVDKTDGCQFYLSKDSLDIEIITAKSSEMNILVPADDGDFKEFALPEQYKTVYNGKTMVTSATDSI